MKSQQQPKGLLDAGAPRWKLRERRWLLVSATVLACLLPLPGPHASEPPDPNERPVGCVLSFELRKMKFLIGRGVGCGWLTCIGHEPVEVSLNLSDTGLYEWKTITGEATFDVANPEHVVGTYRGRSSSTSLGSSASRSYWERDRSRSEPAGKTAPPEVHMTLKAMNRGVGISDASLGVLRIERVHDDRSAECSAERPSPPPRSDAFEIEPPDAPITPPAPPVFIE